MNLSQEKFFVNLADFIVRNFIFFYFLRTDIIIESGQFDRIKLFFEARCDLREPNEKDSPGIFKLRGIE